MRGLLLVILLAFLVYIALQTGFFSKKENLPQKIMSADEKSDQAIIDSDIKHIGTAIYTFFSDSGHYPRALDELIPGYLRTEREYRDPWGQSYQIKIINETEVLLVSAGKDKIFNTPDDIKRRL